MSPEIVKRLAALAGDDVEHTLQSDMDFLERFSVLVASEAGEVMRRRCIAVSCDNPDGFVGGSIRALPGVTLQDLK